MFSTRFYANFLTSGMAYIQNNMYSANKGDLKVNKEEWQTWDDLREEMNMIKKCFLCFGIVKELIKNSKINYDTKQNFLNFKALKYI